MEQELKYFEDQYLKELETIVLKVNGGKVLLKDNIFFPKTKGEPNDLGQVNSIQVNDVQKNDEGVWVILSENNLKIGGKALQEVDWDRRFNAMRAHSALHLVAGIMEKENGLRAVAGNVYPDKAVLTFKQAVPEMAVYAIEEVLSKIVSSGQEIITYWDEKREGFRWCQVADLIPIPCGGLHVKNTGEIGEIELEGKGDKLEIILKNS